MPSYAAPAKASICFPSSLKRSHPGSLLPLRIRRWSGWGPPHTACQTAAQSSRHCLGPGAI